jgi:hypothetical protein
MTPHAVADIERLRRSLPASGEIAEPSTEEVIASKRSYARTISPRRWDATWPFRRTLWG